MASSQLKAIIDGFRSRPPLNLTIQESRAQFERLTAILPLPPDVKVDLVDVNGVPAAWIRTANSVEDKVLYFLHGGGYNTGSIKTHTEMVSRFCRVSGFRALLIDYRLAPEHPFPAGLEDALAAYRWLLGQGIAPSRIIIAGDSAGGGLTLATLVALRDAGDPLPTAAVCMSPWVDMEALGDSMQTNAATDPLIQREGILEMAAMYLGRADPRNPLAAPLYADPTGLPPLLIQAGGAETLQSDSTRFADKAKAAGVDVTLEIWDEMIHVWQVFAIMLPEGQEAIERIAEFMRERVP